MANKQVTIEFRAEDKGLVNQLKKLDNISKQLTNTQDKLHNTEKKSTNSKAKQFQQLNKNYIAIQKLRLSVSKLDSNFENARVSTETLTNALKGNKNAMALLRLQTSAHIVEIKKYNESLKNAKNSTDRFGNALNTAGTGTRILGGTFAVLRSKLLLFNFAMGLGIRKIGHFVNEASKVNAMETAFNTLSGGGRKATVAIDKLTKATDGTVSKMDLFQQANNAMILGVTKNSDEMAEMFDMAQRLGDALGRDTRSSIESLVTGIGRQSRMMLDNIGIIVKSDEAYKVYAETLKKNVDDLTVMERKQAFLNATMEAAKDKISKLPPEVRTARHNFQEMSADIANLTAEIGDFFTPKAEEAAIAVSKLAKSIDVNDMKNMTSAVIGIAGSFGAYKIAVLGVNIAMMKLAFSTALATGGISAAIGLIVALMAKLHMGETNQEFEDLTDHADNLKEEIALLEKESDALAVTTDILTEAQKRNKEQLENNVKGIGSEIKSLILKKAALMGVSDFEIAKLKLDKEFVKNHPKLIDMLEKEFQIIAALEKEKKDKKEADKQDIKNIKDEIKAKAKQVRDEEKLIKERKNALDTIFKNNQHHQFKTLDDQAIYFKSLLDGAEQQAQIDVWLAGKKEEIKKKSNDKIEALNKQHQDRINSARQKVFGDDLNFQLQQLQLEKDKFAKLLTGKENEIALEKWFQGQQSELSQQHLEEKNLIYQATMSSYDAFVDSMLDKDANFLDAEKAIKRAILESTIRFLGEMIKEQIKSFLIEHALQKAQNKKTGSEAMKDGAKIATYYGPGALAKTLAKGAPYVLGVTAAVAAFTAAQKFEKGGEVGGNRHSQGGTLIEAEKGEFVMSRNAVQSIGLENLAQMNATGSSNVTVNIRGHIIGTRGFVRDILIPEINKSVNQGLA